MLVQTIQKEEPFKTTLYCELGFPWAGILIEHNKMNWLHFLMSEASCGRLWSGCLERLLSFDISAVLSGMTWSLCWDSLDHGLRWDHTDLSVSSGLGMAINFMEERSLWCPTQYFSAAVVTMRWDRQCGKGIAKSMVKVKGCYGDRMRVRGVQEYLGGRRLTWLDSSDSTFVNYGNVFWDPDDFELPMFLQIITLN